MIDGILMTWFVLTGLSVAFVAIDIPKTPEATVLKWAFFILTVFTGPFGAFFYILGCREPLKGLHDRYVSSTWRQVLGSTMHCAAGDGIGIIAGAAIGSFLHLSLWNEFLLEYALGFGFGWAFFQAFAMRDMVGGSYIKSLKETFIPELVSMNLLMAGMIATMRYLMPRLDGANDPLQPTFWFIMSMALIVGFILAYPVNWWLVVNNMKHGMLTVRPEANAVLDHSQHPAPTGYDSAASKAPDDIPDDHDTHGSGEQPSGMAILAVTLLTFAILAVSLKIFVI